jgi:hypothetical protein
VGVRGASLLVGAAALLALAPRCGAEPAEPPAAGLELRLEVQDATGRSAQRFADGAQVTLVLEVENRGSAPLALEFPSARTHDFAVLDAQGREVWRWSRGRLFAQVLATVELAPGEVRRFAAIWDQRDAAGARAAPGRYRVVASLDCAPAPPPAGPVELAIE